MHAAEAEDGSLVQVGSRGAARAVDAQLARLVRLAPEFAPHSVRLVVLDDFHVVQLPGGRAYPEHLCQSRGSVELAALGRHPATAASLRNQAARALLPGPEGSPEQAAGGRLCIVVCGPAR
eukprot:scaffold34110_cov74-Phaeocystis_antarctica.AAC.7